MFEDRSFKNHQFNPAPGDSRQLTAIGKENPEILVSTFMAQPDANLRRAAIELHNEKSRILLPLLFKLSDPDWGVRDTAAKALFSLLGSSRDQSSAAAAHFTAKSLLRYAESPVISPEDPSYKPQSPGDPLHSIASISRYNARSGVLRIMQLVVESESRVPRENQRISDLRADLAATVLEACRTAQLRKLTGGDELAWSGRLPPNPLSKAYHSPFVQQIQHASLYYTLLDDKVTNSSPIAAEDHRAFLRERGRSGPMNRTVRGVAILHDELKEYFLVPRLRNTSAMELAGPAFY